MADKNKILPEMTSQTSPYTPPSDLGCGNDSGDSQSNYINNRNSWKTYSPDNGKKREEDEDE
jgi:hypothetical protein